MRHFALLILGLMTFPALALTQVDLYQTEVVLDPTLDHADAAARIEGMKNVIIRVSGDRNAPINPVVQKSLKQSAQYVAQLSNGQVDEQQTLRMIFSAPHIRSLLSQAQLPIWPAARANLLLWLVEEQPERTIMWEHSSSPLLVAIKQQATERGLPLTVPVGDFDDLTGIEVSELWGGFARPISQASQRYSVDAVLVVRAQNDSLRWTLYDCKPIDMLAAQRSPITGVNNGAQAGDKMIDQISDYYAKKSALVVASESSQAVKARFTELNDAVSFFVLEKRLNQLSSVASLDIINIQGSQVTFNVHLLSSVEQFEQQAANLENIKLENEPQLDLEFQKQVELSHQNNVVEDEMVQVQTAPTLTPVDASAEKVLAFKWHGQVSLAPLDEAQSVNRQQVQDESEEGKPDSSTRTFTKAE